MNYDTTIDGLDVEYTAEEIEGDKSVDIKQVSFHGSNITGALEDDALNYLNDSVEEEHVWN